MATRLRRRLYTAEIRLVAADTQNEGEKCIITQRIKTKQMLKK